MCDTSFEDEIKETQEKTRILSQKKRELLNYFVVIDEQGPDNWSSGFI